jgi:hypothetical protein
MFTQIPYVITNGTESYPCLIEVIHYSNVAPCNNADNPYDYYGDEEIEFEILHLDGTDWTEVNDNLTDNQVWEIEKVISNFFYENTKEDLVEDWVD